VKRAYPVGLLIISLMLWILLLEKGEKTTREVNLPFQELKGVRINTESSKGEVWRLEAERVVIDNNDRATIYDVTFRSGGESNSPLPPLTLRGGIKGGVISLKAPRGIYEITTGDAEVMDGVIIKLPDGSTGKVESLRIERGKIKSDAPVVLEKDNMKITGKGIVTDELGNLKILRDVRVEFK
jgi:hypothetical protein